MTADLPVTSQRKVYTPEQKFRIVLESLQRDTTLEAVRLKYGVAKSVLMRWRDDFKAVAPEAIFGDKRNPKTKAKLAGYAPGQSPDELKNIIGELTVQNEILKEVQGLLN